MAGDMFLKFGDIKGESADAKYKEWIPIESWSWGESQAGSAGRGAGSGVGKVDMSDFSFMKFMDKATPKLILACANGQHIPAVEFVARKAGGEQAEYLKMKLSDVLISSYQTSGSSGGSLPTESISINFSKIEFEYLQQDAKGKTASAGKMNWDVRANKGGS
jgi:type VI secretion system secreted protein Hcp